MDGGQDLRLTWVNYSQKLTESFNKFLRCESLCNVTLFVNQRKSIKAHQAILSACSPWFEEVLMANKHPHPIIILKDVRFEDLKNIIKFIYTGEVSVPHQDIQEFLRAAELLEVKGLLRGMTNQSPMLFDHNQTVTDAGMAFGAQNTSAITTLPTLPTVPVSSVLLGGNSGPITDGGIDLVSQIKVPVSISSTNLASPTVSPDGSGQISFDNPSAVQIQVPVATAPTTHSVMSTKKRRKTGGQSGYTTLKKRGVDTGLNNTQNYQANNIVSTASNLMTTNILTAGGSHHSADGPVDEDVTWGSTIDDDVGNGHELTPAQIVSSGITDCGSFKRIWAERYLCYNLGREIICLLCFCRFTQFKKFNLERHMKNKHSQLYNLPEETRKMILHRYVERYQGMITSLPSPSSNDGAVNNIMTVGPITCNDIDSLNLNLDHDQSETASAVAEISSPLTGDGGGDSKDGKDNTTITFVKGEDDTEGGLLTANNQVVGRVTNSSASDSQKSQLSDQDQNQSVEEDHLIVECQLQGQEGELVLVKEEKAFTLS